MSAPSHRVRADPPAFAPQVGGAPVACRPRLSIVGGAISSGDADTAPTFRHARKEEPSSFDVLEKQAIRFGDTDSLWGRAPNGRLSRALVLIFGLRFPTPLADPRLEALRRLALALRRGPSHVDRAVAATEAVGLSRAKIDFLLQRSGG